MEEKNLSRLDIERNSGYTITDAHVATILAGNADNPKLKTLLALAKGLDVEPIEVLKAAAEVGEPEDSWTAESLITVIRKIVNLKPAEIKKIKKMLKVE
ncbi:MAG: hypothetical protein WBV94_07540 [Blastocatellia bacterium]